MRTATACCILMLAGVGAAMVSPGLARCLAAVGESGHVPACILLREQTPLSDLRSAAGRLSGAERRVRVARSLRTFSAYSQRPLVRFLQGAGAENIVPLWIVNAVYCEATPRLIAEVAERPDVWFVDSDRQHAPGLFATPEPAADEVPWGVTRIRAPEVWAQGITGRNTVVAVITTGVNYNHYDLADHMWTAARYPHHGWDFENGDDDPMDSHGHGTFTAGVVAADGTGGSQCGVAPDAQVMALRVRTTADSISEMQCWQAMEFAVSPPLAERAGANAYVMPLGWLLSWQPHQAAWRQAVVNTNAAGLVQVAPSGSERGTPPPNACRCPGHVPPPWWNPDNTGVGALAGMVTTGGVDSSDVIASMSSPGPVTWMNVPPYSDFAHPPGLTKPEVVAPAINIKSLGLGGGYTVMSGTSWATAFVGAVAALMLSKDSTLLPADVDSILELTAVDLGPARKDNDYGAGRIDAYAAVNYIGTAVAEGRSPSAARHRASIVSRADLRLPPGALLLDAAGRPAAEASGLAPGVYFVRERPRSGSSRITGMVVIAR